MPDEHGATGPDRTGPPRDAGGAYESAVEGIHPGGNRMLGRRSAAEQSQSGLVSRDYQPRTGGPELMASWPLGAPPRQTEPGDLDWRVTGTDWTMIQKHHFSMPYVGPIDYAKLYIGVTGIASVDEDEETLGVRLENRHVEGDAYDATARIHGTSDATFATPMIEFAPDVETFTGRGRTVGGYTVSARVSGGTAWIDQGTAVQLWAE